MIVAALAYQFLVKVIFQKRVRVFHWFPNTRKKDGCTRLQAEWLYCFTFEFLEPQSNQKSEFLKLLLQQLNTGLGSSRETWRTRCERAPKNFQPYSLSHGWYLLKVTK